ncbi:hypothetical protein JQC92_01655 [Shewanella sp. 202IG2-18]|uniref:hypothetical protein n=1 Tax=Parashewanella hymeniacidonis TaxID=2807618 RepID=UPI00195F5237|nr:hypothetical protein [Parashewanella hymeniacidonis]MBM7070748.1 hypothetical protein [Parashewanella hymeniacidonis]
MNKTEPLIKIHCEVCGGQTVRLNMANDDGTSSCKHPTCTCKPNPSETSISAKRESANTIITLTKDSIQQQIQQSSKRKVCSKNRIISWVKSKFKSE